MKGQQRHLPHVLSLSLILTLSFQFLNTINAAVVERWYTSGPGSGNGLDAAHPKSLYTTGDTDNNNASLFDNEIGWLVDGWYPQGSQIPSTTQINLYFYPGLYVTDGISARHPYLQLIGNNAGNTNAAITFRLKPGASYDGSGFKYVFGTEYYLSDIRISHIDFDCNWAGQTSYNHSGYTGGYKLGGIVAKTVTGLVDWCKVYNFGSNEGATFQAAGYEVFPLKLITGNFGQGPLPNETAPLVIRNNQVHTFTTVGKGYCTAINIVTHDADVPDCNCTSNPPQNRQINAGNRTSLLGNVYANYVYNVPKGIAYGTAHSEQVEISANRADNAAAAFNCDTPAAGGSRAIKIYYNIFTNCDTGIKVGAPAFSEPVFTSVEITGNYVTSLRGWASVPNSAVRTECYGIRLDGAVNDVYMFFNVITAVPSASFDFPALSYFNSPPPDLADYYFYTERPTGKIYFPIRIAGAKSYIAPWNGQMVAEGAYTYDLTPANLSYQSGIRVFAVAPGYPHRYIPGSQEYYLEDGNRNFWSYAEFMPQGSYVTFHAYYSGAYFVTADFRRRMWYNLPTLSNIFGNSPSDDVNTPRSP